MAKLSREGYDLAVEMFRNGNKPEAVAERLSYLDPEVQKARDSGGSFMDIGRGLWKTVQDDLIQEPDLPGAGSFAIEAFGKPLVRAGEMVIQQAVEHPVATLAAPVAAGLGSAYLAPRVLSALGSAGLNALAPNALAALVRAVPGLAAAAGYTGTEAAGNVISGKPVVEPAIRSGLTGATIALGGALGGLPGAMVGSGMAAAAQGAPSEDVAASMLVPPVFEGAIKGVGKVGKAAFNLALPGVTETQPEGQAAYKAIGDPSLPRGPIESKGVVDTLSGLSGERGLRPDLGRFVDQAKQSIYQSLNKIIPFNRSQNITQEQLVNLQKQTVEQEIAGSREKINSAMGELNKLSPGMYGPDVLQQIYGALEQVKKEVYAKIDAALPTSEAVSLKDLGGAVPEVHKAYYRQVYKPASDNYGRVVEMADAPELKVPEASLLDLQNTVKQLRVDYPEVLKGQTGMSTANRAGGLAGQGLEAFKNQQTTEQQLADLNILKGSLPESNQVVSQMTNELTGLLSKIESGKMNLYELRNAYKDLNALYASAMSTPQGNARRIYTILQQAVNRAMENTVNENAGAINPNWMGLFKQANSMLKSAYGQRDQIEKVVGNRFKATEANAEDLGNKLMSAYGKSTGESNIDYIFSLLPTLEPTVQQTLIAAIKKSVPQEKWIDAVNRNPKLRKLFGAQVSALGQELQTQTAGGQTPEQIMNAYSPLASGKQGAEAATQAKYSQADYFLGQRLPGVREQLAAESAKSGVGGLMNKMTNLGVEKPDYGTSLAPLSENTTLMNTKAGKILGQLQADLQKEATVFDAEGAKRMKGSELLRGLPTESVTALLHRLFNQDARFHPKNIDLLFDRIYTADPKGYQPLMESLMGRILMDESGKLNLTEVGEMPKSVGGTDLQMFHVIESMLKANRNPTFQKNVKPFLDQLKTIAPAAENVGKVESSLERIRPTSIVSAARQTSSAADIQANAIRTTMDFATPQVLAAPIRAVLKLGSLISAGFGPTALGKLLLSNDGQALSNAIKSVLRAPSIPTAGSRHGASWLFKEKKNGK